MLKRVSSRFLLQTFCLMVPKDIVVELFCAMVLKTSEIGKFYKQEWQEGRNIKIFPRKLFSHSAEKFRKGTLSVSLTSGIEKF